MSLGKTHYLMSQDTHKALAGPMTCAAVVNIINSLPKSEAGHYYNSSRYDLYKHGHYPRTKAGDAALAEDVRLAAWVTEEVRIGSPFVRVVSESPTIIDGRLVHHGKFYNAGPYRFIRFDFGRDVWQGCHDLKAKDWHDLELMDEEREK